MPERRASRSGDAVPGRPVWPTGGVDRVAQLAAGGYLPATATDTTGLPPAVAAHAVRTYTEPGDTVLDPDCGAGTVLVEAVRAGRHAVGMTGGRWWPLARGNLNAAKLAGALTDGMVLQRPDSGSGYPRSAQPRSGQRRSGQPWSERPRGDLTAGTASGLTGRVDLLLTGVRLDSGPDRTRSRREAVGSPGGLDSDPRTDLVRVTADRLAAVLARCRPLLRPGGHVILLVQPGRSVATPAGAPAATEAPDVVTVTAARAGLVPVERCLAPITHRPSPNHRPSRTRRRSADRGHRRPVPATTHLDVYVFLAPPDVGAPAAAALPVPTPTVATAEGPRPSPGAAGRLDAPGRWAA